MPGGSFVGALISGILTDWIGRRQSIAVACCFWLVGSILSCASQNLGMLIVGRFICGLCVGESRMRTELSREVQKDRSLCSLSTSLCIFQESLPLKFLFISLNWLLLISVDVWLPANNGLSLGECESEKKSSSFENQC